MTQIHDSNVWMLDRRPIIEAEIDGVEGMGVFRADKGCLFERFERNGEMASIPYLRISTMAGVEVEAPLVKFQCVTFGELVE